MMNGLTPAIQPGAVSERDPDIRPRKKRKPRPRFSCSECRRLKMKCDRQDPCGSCIQRECPNLCRQSVPSPTETLSTSASGTRQPSSSQMDLQAKVRLLEQLLDQNGIPVPFASSPPEPRMVVQQRTPTTGGGEREEQQFSPTAVRDQAIFASATRSSILQTPICQTQIDADHSMMSTTGGSLSVDPMPASYSSLQPPSSSIYASGGQPDVNIVTDEHRPEVNEEQNFGTLMISESGRSRYLGGTAGSEWLKHQQGDVTPPIISRAASPSEDQEHTPWSRVDLVAGKVAFPFNIVSTSISTSRLVSMLPRRSDAKIIIDCFFRQFAWHFNAAPRKTIDRIFEHVYNELSKGVVTSKSIRPDELALLYIVLAMGSYYNLELAADDTSAEEFLAMSKSCLAKGDFMANHTLAAVQTLLIMSHLQLSLDCGKNADSAWPLWGLTTRMANAMGLHRDGERWNLGKDSIQERRRVFWEVHCTDVLTSNCFCRPGGTVNPEYIDTSFPILSENVDDLETFYRYKFDMTYHSHKIYDHTLRVRPQPYSHVEALHADLCDFERNIAFHLRCRPVLCALPSIYPDPESAILSSPPMNKRDMQLTFQQFTLEMNISESFIFLHRPYFARAIHNSPQEPARDVYGLSYLSVVERCNAIVVIAYNLFNAFPQAASRHWWIWFHAFNAAACMATLVLKNPRNPLAGFALSLVDTTIDLYTSVVQNRNSPRMAKNLQWLIRLRQKTGVKMSQAPEETTIDEKENNSEVDDDDVEILGWRTKLIERAGQGLQKTSTIHSGSAPSNASRNSTGTGPSNSDSNAPSTSGNAIFDIFADSLLSQFWDPAPTATSQEPFSQGDASSLEWWNFFADFPTDDNVFHDV